MSEAQLCYLTTERCFRCPAAGLGVELGTEVSQAASDTVTAVGLEALGDMTLTQLRETVKKHGQFSPAVEADGAPYHTVMGVIRKTTNGDCAPNLQ